MYMLYPVSALLSVFAIFANVSASIPLKQTIKNTTEESTKESTTDHAPATIEEAYQRLTNILGRPSEMPQLTRFELNDEIVTEPEKDGTKIIVVDKGLQFYTNPVLSGDTILFHQNENIVRNVYNQSPSGERSVNRRLDRTYSMEFRITKFGSTWLCQQRLVNHSKSQYNQIALNSGTINWLPNGFEMVTIGFDQFYTPDGTLAPNAYIQWEKLTLDGQRVVVETKDQAYKAVKTDEGVQLLIPDFDKPIGEGASYRRVSEPRIATD